MSPILVDEGRELETESWSLSRFLLWGALGRERSLSAL